MLKIKTISRAKSKIPIPISKIGKKNSYIKIGAEGKKRLVDTIYVTTVPCKIRLYRGKKFLCEDTLRPGGYVLVKVS